MSVAPPFSCDQVERGVPLPWPLTQALASKESLEKAHRYSKPIATQIVPAVTFYPAEDYHQQYLEKRGLASCHVKY